MSQGNATRNAMVGIAFLGSLVVLGAATLLVKGVPFLGVAEALEVRFAAVGGLNPGDDVKAHGVRVGQVDSVVYDATEPNFPVLVRCTLNQELDIDEGTKFTVQSVGPLGGQFLGIDIGIPAVELPSPKDGVRYGTARSDLFEQVAELIDDNDERIGEILEGIRAIVNDIRAGKGMMGRLVENEELGQEFERAIKQIQSSFETFETTLKSISEGDGMIGRMVSEKTLGDDFAGAVKELRDMLKSINEADGVIGSLIKDEELRDRVAAIVEDLKAASTALREEKGAVGLLLHNEETRENARTAIRNLREVTEAITKGEGVVSELLSNLEMAETLGNTLEDIHDVVHKANEGQGTLGQLINNREAWDELVRILVLARETLEDLREQAPVSTFVNAVFAAF